MSSSPEEEEIKRRLEKVKKRSIQAIRAFAYQKANRCWGLKKSSNYQIRDISAYYMTQMLIPKIFENFKRDWEEADKYVSGNKIPCPVALEDCLITNSERKGLL